MRLKIRFILKDERHLEEEGRGENIFFYYT
jgi:hypothetical protein